MREIQPLVVVAPVFLCPLLSRVMSGNRSFSDVYDEPAPLQPPGWVFGPVWTLLYGLLGYALSMSLLDDSPERVHENARRDMLVLLAVNVLWTPVFLRRRVAAALLLLLLMIAQAAWTIDHSPGLAPFVGPYLAWLCFAAYLNSVYVARYYNNAQP